MKAENQKLVFLILHMKVDSTLLTLYKPPIPPLHHRHSNSGMKGRFSTMEDENKLKKGPWTPKEDNKLIDYIQKHGHGSWRALPKLAGLNRCGKSCRLRWTNYLRPDIKRGKFSQQEEQTIIDLHAILGNKWSAIAQNLSGRTDNEIKNFWNTHLKKKLLQMGIDPVTHRPRTDLNVPDFLSSAAKLQLLNNIIQHLSTPFPTNLFGPHPQHLCSPQLLGEGCAHFSNLEALLQPSVQGGFHPNMNYVQLDGSNTFALPDLVCGSPVTKTNPDGISNPSSTSATFEGWEDLMDQGSDAYWTQIIEEASCEPWVVPD